MKIKNLLCLLGLALLCSLSTVQAQGTLNNPIVNGNFPDPWILQHDGWYYWCKQDFGSQITIERFRNLQDITRSEGWTKIWSLDWNIREAVWAPELHYINGKWYVFSSGDTDPAPGLQNLRMFVLESNNWNGPYTFKGIVNTGDFRWEWCIDPSILVHPKTKAVYMSWSQWEGGMQCIYIGQLDPNNYSRLLNATKLSQPDFDWEKKPFISLVNEAPEFLIKNNKLHIAYSASQCHSRYYSLGLLSTDLDRDLLNRDSWSKSSVPVFSEAYGAWGPGHNCFVKSPDNTQDWIVYHAHTQAAWEDANERGDRAIFAQQFTWNGDFPVFGAPKTGGPYAAPSTSGGGGGPSGPVTTGAFSIISRLSNQSLDVAGCSTDVGANVQQWPYWGGSCQRWLVEPTDNGYVKIISVLSGMALDVENGGTADGTNVRQWPWNGSFAQQWKVEPTDNGYSRIISRASGLALDVNQCSASNGANVQQWTYWGGNCQQWKLEPASSQLRVANPELASKAKPLSLEISPNPADKHINIGWQSSGVTPANISISNAQGLKVYEGSLKATDSKQINTSSLSPGMYIISIKSGKLIKTSRLLIQR